jgi:hypothetical protein
MSDDDIPRISRCRLVISSDGEELSKPSSRKSAVVFSPSPPRRLKRLSRRVSRERDMHEEKDDVILTAMDDFVVDDGAPTNAALISSEVPKKLVGQDSSVFCHKKFVLEDEAHGAETKFSIHCLSVEIEQFPSAVQ